MQHSAPAARDMAMASPASGTSTRHDMTTHRSVGSRLPADANTQEKQRIFLDQILAGTTRLRDARAAKAEGWTRITGGDGATVHVINDRLMQDGKTLDPANPEVLIYRVDGSKWSLIGAMFQGGRDGAIDNKDGLALKNHGHDGSAADSAHVWFMPGDLAKAYGDRGDPPDELMGDMNWNNAAGNAFRMNQANTEATKRAFAAL